MRAKGSQMSGNGYGSRDSVQAPLILITAFARRAGSSTFGRSAHGSGGAGGTRGCRMPRWSRMKRVSGWRSISAVPASRLSQHNRLTGKSWRTAARAMRSRPGWFGSRLFSFVSMMRMPTVPGVFFQSATTSAKSGSSRATGLTMGRGPGGGQAPGMGLRALDRVARVVAVHRKGRDEDRAVDADLVHRRHHFVAGDVSRPVRHGGPRPRRRVRLIGMDLGIDDHHP